MDPVRPTLLRKNLRYWLLQPDARLRDHVRCYFVVDALPGGRCRHTEGSSSDELLIPDGYAEIVFILGAGFERWNITHGSGRTVMTRSYLIGGRSHSVQTRVLGHLQLVGVKLEPCALRRIIATPLTGFRDSTLELRELNNGALLRLEDAVAEASSVREIAAVLDHFFLRHLCNGAGTGTDRRIAPLMAHIRTRKGAVAVTQWMRDHGLDARTLERNFTAWIGMGPKRYARVVRFKHSYHRLISGPRDVAASLREHLDGYYDQSHFNKEFRSFTGMAPSALMAGRMDASISVTNHLLQGDLSPETIARPAAVLVGDPCV